MLVGDAFSTACPVSGRGAIKAMVDAQRLCSAYVPQWLQGREIGADEIAAFYCDPEKLRSDAHARHVSLFSKRLALEPGLDGPPIDGFGWPAPLAATPCLTFRTHIPITRIRRPMPALSLVDNPSQADSVASRWPFMWAGFAVHAVMSMSGLEAEWRKLEANGVSSLFQSFGYLQAWFDEAARLHGETPVMVLGYKGAELAFVLPMAVTRPMGVPTLGWMSQAHSNYGMGLLGADVLKASSKDIDRLVRELADRTGAAAVWLDKQPLRWGGHDNPFAATGHVRMTPNDTYVLHLEDDYAAQHRRLFSSRTMSGLKRKQRKLEEGRQVVFAQLAPGPERTHAIAWFFTEKRRQLCEGGKASPFDEGGIQALYGHLAEHPTAFEVAGLYVDGELIAVGLTAYQGDTAFLINTAYADNDLVRFSPGALLFQRMVAQAHQRGIRVYDFGPGFLPYKVDWQPEIVPLVISSWLIRLPGILPLAAARAKNTLKSIIKRNPMMHRWASHFSASLKNKFYYAITTK